MIQKVRLYPILLFFLIVTAAQAETVSWHDGVVVLKSNEVLVGKLTIQPALNVILFRSEDNSAFFRLEEVDYITYHDQDVNMSRKFLSRSFPEHDGKRYSLYEVVISGALSVIRKPRSAYVPDVTDVGSFDYYVMEHGSIVQLTQFRKKVFPSMEASCNKPQLKMFMRENGLDPNNNEDALQLIKYFNEGAIATTMQRKAYDILL